MNTYKVNEEAVKKIAERVYDNGSTVINRNDLEEMFPALKESEDERIMGNIIATIHLYYGEPLEDEAKEMIAWLEKQGEHAKFRNSIKVGDKVTRNRDGMLVNLSQLKRVAKPAENKGEHDMGISEATKQELEDNLNKALEKETPESWNEFLDDKVEPKFKVGDWVILTAGELSSTFKIVGIDSKKKKYYFDDYSFLPIVDEDLLSLWTIKDAKEGDTLSDGCTLFIFKEVLSDGSIMTYCDYNKVFTNVPMNLICSQVHPTTKEQRATLMKAMADAGYEWDADKKELKKIEQKPADTEKGAKGNDREIPNSAWSEDDEQYIIDTISLLSFGCSSHSVGEVKDFLKSLKNRYTWKPSDEQMEALVSAIDIMIDNRGAGDKKTNLLSGLYHELKAL